MEIKQIIRDLIKESLNEAVEVSHSRYMRSHGKKAKGSGNWIFTTKEMGEPSKDEMVTVSGNVSDAGKEAAKKLGSNRVYVMESFDTVKEEFVTEQFNTKKGEAKEYDGKKYIGLDLFWNDEKFGEVYPHTANSQTKRAGSKIATSQKRLFAGVLDCLV